MTRVAAAPATTSAFAPLRPAAQIAHTQPRRRRRDEYSHRRKGKCRPAVRRSRSNRQSRDARRWRRSVADADEFGVALCHEVGCDAGAYSAVTKVLADRPTRYGQRALRRCRSHRRSRHQPERADLFPDGLGADSGQTAACWRGRSQRLPKCPRATGAHSWTIDRATAFVFWPVRARPLLWRHSASSRRATSTPTRRSLRGRLPAAAEAADAALATALRPDRPCCARVRRCRDCPTAVALSSSEGIGIVARLRCGL